MAAARRSNRPGRDALARANALKARDQAATVLYMVGSGCFVAANLA